MEDTTSCLESCPPEALSDILYPLGGRNILRLYMCGNKRLIHNMTTQGGVKRFKINFKTPSEVCIPSLIYLLRNLQHLELSVIHYIRQIPLVVGWELERLPTSLKTLNMTLFRDSECFYDNMDVNARMKPLVNILPNLQQLSDNQNLLKMNSSNFSLLPNLTCLHLHNPVETSAIQHLPRTITLLDIDMVDFDGKTDPLFPPSLTTLYIGGLMQSMLVYLPCTLTSLNTKYAGSGSESVWDSNFPEQLPVSLKVLKLPGITIEWHDRVVERLSRSIEVLEFEYYSVPLNRFWSFVKALPPHLREVRGMFMTEQPSGISESEIELAQTKFSSLRFSMYPLSPLWEAMEWYPPNLQELSGLRLPLRKTSFPNSIQSLLFLDTGPGQAAPIELPEQLKDIDSPYVLHNTTMRSLSACRHLSDVSLTLSPSQIQYLPKTLSRLTWTCDKGDQLFPRDLSFKDFTKLKFIHAKNLDSSQTQFLSTLPTSVESVIIHAESPLNADVLLHFNPKSVPKLRFLSFATISGCTDDHLSNLPPKLLVLKIHQLVNQYDWFFWRRLSPNCFLRMPSSITSISIPCNGLVFNVGHLKFLQNATESHSKLIT